MIDRLIQHLLEEIAMDGDVGTDVSRLSSFIDEYFNHNRSEATASTSASQSPSMQQKIDPAFLSFVWDTLVAQNDVHVGVLKSVETRMSPRIDTPADVNDDDTASATAQGDLVLKQEDTSGNESAASASKASASKKGKQKSKAGATHTETSTDATHDWHALQHEERTWSREKLIEKYGNDLRVAVGAETAWIAITGSSMRPGALTRPVYSMLQYVSRSRGEGATVVAMGRDLDVDQKSVFHLVKVALNLGIVKKFRTIDLGSWTNRILHVRYLSTSPRWAAFTKTDDYEAEVQKEQQQGGDGDEEEDAQAGTSSVLRMGAIGREHLDSNEGLIRSRIVKALQARDQKFMPHIQVARAIGLYNYIRLDLRRLNWIISAMADEGIIEKTIVYIPGKKLPVQCVRLLLDGPCGPRETARRQDQAGDDEGNLDGKGDEDEDEEDTSPHALVLVTVEKQVLDLLTEAGEEGLYNTEIGQALGGLANRSVDQCFVRLGRPYAVPPHLGDFTIHTATETIGREKRTKYFSAPGYLRRCARDGALDGTQRMHALVTDERVGGWGEVDSGTLYESPRDRRDKVKTIDLRKGGKRKGGDNVVQRGDPWSHVGDNRSSDNKSKIKRYRRRNVEGDAAGDSEDDAESVASSAVEGDREPNAKPKTKRSKKTSLDQPRKRIGRPPLPPKERVPGAKLTYYERRKIEDAERAAQGLPPKPKRPAAGGGRRSKETLALMAKEKEEKERIRREKREAGILTTEDEDESTNKPEKKKRGRKPKATAQRKSTAAPETPEAGARDDAAPAADEIPVAVPPEDDRSEHAIPAEPEGMAALAAAAEEVSQSNEQSPVPVAVVSAEPEAPKRKRGRPRKNPDPSAAVDESSATIPANDATAQAAPVPKKRGRPKKNSQPEPEATSEPADVPEPEAVPKLEAVSELAPEPDAAPPVVQQSESSTPGTQQPVAIHDAAQAEPEASTNTKKRPATTAGPTSPKKRARMYPVVEIETRSPPKRSLGSQGGQHSAAAAAGPDPPASGPAAEIGPASSRDTSVVPVIAHTAPRRKTTQGPRKSATPAVPRVNLANLARQAEILDWLKESGGIADEDKHFTESVRACAARKDPSKPAYKMDSKSCSRALLSMADRGLIRLTTVTNPQGRGRVISLPEMALNSPEMTEHLRKTANREHRSRGQFMSDLPVAQDLNLSTQTTSVDRLLPAEDPTPGDEPVEVRAFFERNHQISGHRYGCYYGRMARARHLHSKLVEYAYQGDDSQGQGHASNEGVVVSRTEFFEQLAFGDLLKIMPFPIANEEFEKYASDSSHAMIQVRMLPTFVQDALALSSKTRLKRLWAALEVLIDLQIISTLDIQRDLETDQPTGVYESARVPQHSTHWQLAKIAPLYAFSHHEAPLIAVHDITTEDSASVYWAQLFVASFPSKGPPPVRLTEETACGFSTTYQGNKDFNNRITSSTKWHDGYLLIATQRRFLAKLVEQSSSILDRPDEIKSYASMLLAPVPIVTAYLQHVHKLRGRPSKRVRIASSQDRRDDPILSARPPMQQRKMAHVSNTADAQREIAFNAVVNRFKRDHPEVSIPERVAEFLHKRFCKSSRGQIDLVQLEMELNLLLPGDRPVEASSYISIVPPTIRGGPATNQQDVSAVKRRPGLKGRTHASTDGLGNAAQANEDEGHEEEEEAVDEDSEAEEDPQGAQKVDYTKNRQNEFLSVPAKPPPVPVLPGAQRRLPRNYFTHEQDELLLDAVAVVKARCARCDAPRLVWRPINQLFSDIDPNRLRHRFNRIIARPYESTYHDNLVDAWQRVYDEQIASGGLIDPAADDLLAFDLAEHVHCLRAHISKQALRLTGPRDDPGDHETPVELLPGSIAELKDRYVVKLPSFDLENRWPNYWKTSSSSLVKDAEACLTPFVISFVSAASADQDDRKTAHAAAALKMLCLQSGSKYDPDLGKQFLAHHEDHIALATIRLEEEGVLSRSGRAGRRVPGRAYEATHKFHQAFNDAVVPLKLEQANKAQRAIHEGKYASLEEHWPLLAKDGDMISFLDSVSAGSVNATIDTQPTLALRDPLDYQTRQKDDEAIECAVIVQPTEDRMLEDATPPMMPLDAPSPDFTDDQAILSAAREKLELDSTPVVTQALKILDAISNSGPHGLCSQEVASAVPGLNASLLHKLVSVLTTNAPPLAFWAGSTRPSLIASSFLSEWTVATFSFSMRPIRDIYQDTVDGHGGNNEQMNRAGQPTEGEHLAVAVKLPQRRKARTSTIRRGGEQAKRGLRNRKSRGGNEEPADEGEDGEAEGDSASGPINLDLDELERLRGQEIDPDSIVEQDRRVFPAIWRDLSGEVRPAVWKNACAWIKSMILRHGGSTVNHLFARTRSSNHLTLHEIMLILESLERQGVIKRMAADAIVQDESESRRAHDHDDDDDDCDILGWDNARFFLTEKWFSA